MYQFSLLYKITPLSSREKIDERKRVLCRSMYHCVIGHRIHHVRGQRIQPVKGHQKYPDIQYVFIKALSDRVLYCILQYVEVMYLFR